MEGAEDMTSNLPTPVSVLETYFERQLLPKNLTSWSKISDDEWFDFSKTYLVQMKSGLSIEALEKHARENKTRLYFDHMYNSDYGDAVRRRYASTPLLGQQPYPRDDADYAADGLNRALAPLRKHLLIADELYIPDNFFRCFDFVADVAGRNWRNEHPNIQDSVRRGIAGIRGWLPILASLRDLVSSNAVIFMPYYLAPSFPYVGGEPTPFMAEQIRHLRIPPEPGLKRAGSATFDLSKIGEEVEAPRSDTRSLDTTQAVYAWINARLMGLDPVYADKNTWKWASKIRLKGESRLPQTTEIMSIDILPLGERKTLTAAEIVSMRKNEEIFRLVRETLSGCKDYIRSNVAEDASREFLTKICRTYVGDHLKPNIAGKIVRFIDNNYVASTAIALAVGTGMLLVHPPTALATAATVVGPATATPKAAGWALRFADKNLKAAAWIDSFL
jgi:hypothetical protein